MGNYSIIPVGGHEGLFAFLWRPSASDSTRPLLPGWSKLWGQSDLVFHALCDFQHLVRIDSVLRADRHRPPIVASLLQRRRRPGWPPGLPRRDRRACKHLLLCKLLLFVSLSVNLVDCLWNVFGTPWNPLILHNSNYRPVTGTKKLHTKRPH